MDYNRQMEETLQTIPRGTPLLLHACCGPCAAGVLERLCAHCAVTLWYHNPNIWPQAEYERRRGELARLLQKPPGGGRVALQEGPWRPQAFEAAVQGLEAEAEGGARCAACFGLRMDAAAAEAAALGIEWFTTTLTVSPHKNAARLNEAGQRAAQKHGVRFLPCDFKKKDGYRRSMELSKQYGLYRQDYCGCRFSQRRPAE